jgi:flavorubredoxin
MGPNQTVVVVDGGYPEVRPELVKHIRSYHRTNHVNLIVSTHPDADHVNGLRTVSSTFATQSRGRRGGSTA